MEIFNLLTTASYPFTVQNIDPVSLNWIGNIIKWLIEGIGVIGLGVIVFTLILKTIVLPLDIYSRASSKKQAIVMEQMRPQMEKLQKQYANDEKMYNQKVGELYKSSGYNMFGACIPMIVSLVIFMVVFSAFSSYSQYANLEQYRNMVTEYNNHIYSYVGNLEGDELIFDDGKEENNFLFIVETDENGNVYYSIDYDVFAPYYKQAVLKDESKKVEIDETSYTTAEEYFETLTDDGRLETLKYNFVNKFVTKNAQEAVAEYYHNNNSSFLWVKNLWYPDSMLNKEIPDYSQFTSSVTKTTFGDNYEESYNKVTGGLEKEKNTYNGYFILILLSIGGMLLQQWITSRSQKSVNDLSTVDGSGAQTNKMMMILMPVMYGIFSFFYSAAFSIYMITNTVYSIVTTLIINKVVDSVYAKKAQQAERARFERKVINNGKRK